MRINYFILLVSLTGLFLEAQSQTPVLESWKDYSDNKKESVYHTDWVSVGPVVNSGRVESLGVDPDNPAIIYAGFGSGNLWKSTNHGFSWYPIFDNQAGYSIGDICLAPSNSSIVYLGTGENVRAWRGHTIAGAGIYRSDDAGKTWKHLGLPDSYHIGRVAVHPYNPDVVLVAALGHFYSANEERGVFKSTDGGQNWKKVLYVNELTGASDVIYSPTNPDLVYATTWQCSDVIGGPGSGAYVSRDGGDTWEKMIDGLPNGDMNGRSSIAVSYQNDQLAYLLTDNLNRSKGEGTCELYRTVDGGRSWQKTHTQSLKNFSSFGHVFADCYVNPQNDQEVYLLGIAVLSSIDGGRTFTQLAGEIANFIDSPANYLHVDHHDMWINPENPDHLILGNDGGIYISYDRAQTWMHYNNLPVGEFYFVRTDHSIPYRIYGGTQDDAAVRGPALPWKNNAHDPWEYVWIDPWTGGDGIVTDPDPEDPDIVYYESQVGEINRKNMRTGERKGIKPEMPKNVEDELVREWLTPFFVSRFNHTTLYYGANYVFKTIDRGENWSVISQNLAEPKDKKRKGGGVTALEESPVEPGIIYAGTAKGAIWVTQDDGHAWNDISKGLPHDYVKSFAPSRFHTARVYVSLNGIKRDDFSPMVFKSENYGDDWESIAGNLPDSHVNVILEDPVFENVLYIGTSNGVWVSDNGGNSWQVLGDSIPNSFVADITIQERDLDLIAATHGRGIYVIDLEPLHTFWNDGADDASVLHVSPAILPKRDQSGAKPDLTSYYPVRVSLLIPEAGEYTVSLSDSQNNQVYSTEQYFKKGLNTWQWDMIVEKRQEDNPYFYQFNQFIKAGRYKIDFRGADQNFSSRLVVKNFE